MTDPFDPSRNAGNNGQDADKEYNLEDMIKRIPEGTHPARLVNIKDSESQAGNQMLIWEFIIMSGPAAGMSISAFTALTPAAMWKVQGILTGLGLTPKFRRSDAINRMCLINVVHETYNGADRDSLKDVLPHPNGVGSVWSPGAPLADIPTESTSKKK